mmetsp:Transcript_41027/g.103379  ORF Transcript_41027/g.103379 Transcript_41027/m.103379 type:complete len:215 (-) Transcript_41027:1602-2246(-)
MRVVGDLRAVADQRLEDVLDDLGRERKVEQQRAEQLVLAAGEVQRGGHERHVQREEVLRVGDHLDELEAQRREQTLIAGELHAGRHVHLTQVAAHDIVCVPAVKHVEEIAHEQRQAAVELARHHRVAVLLGDSLANAVLGHEADRLLDELGHVLLVAAVAVGQRAVALQQKVLCVQIERQTLDHQLEEEPHHRVHLVDGQVLVLRVVLGHHEQQ